jgi:hypothetical protein
MALLIVAVALVVIGFALGTAGVDPLSAWVGTVGLAGAVVALVWLAAARLRARRS